MRRLIVVRADGTRTAHLYPITAALNQKVFAFFNIDLITLSACDTGMGPPYP